jgi:hypothetical protein
MSSCLLVLVEYHADRVLDGMVREPALVYCLIVLMASDANIGKDLRLGIERLVSWAF